MLLIGVARSGTSWLGQALGRAAGARFYSEPDNIDADTDEPWSAGRHGYGPYPMIESDNESAFAPVWDMVFSGRYPFNRGRRWLKPAGTAILHLPPAVRGPLARGTARVSSQLPMAPGCVVAKTIYAVLSLDWLICRYQPSVVVVQRNPLNVVSSWRELRMPLFDLAVRRAVRERYLEPAGIQPLPTEASELSRVAWHVGLLTHALGEAVERHPECHLVNHDLLCSDPRADVRKVFELVGLTWTERAERFLRESNRPGNGFERVRIAAEQPDRWRSRLTAAEVVEVEEVLARFPRRGWLRFPEAAA